MIKEKYNLYYVSVAILLNSWLLASGHPTVTPPQHYTYSYIEETRSWYKLHEGATWQNAVDICSSDDSKLFYPEDENEARAVKEKLNIFNENIFQTIWIGISNLQGGDDRNTYKTIDGRSIDNVYNGWRGGEPDSYEDNRCVAMNAGIKLWVASCSARNYKFVCKKTPRIQEFVPDHTEYRESTTETDSSERNTVNTGDNKSVRGYIHIEQTNRWYKLHKLKRWQDAVDTCAGEGGELFYPGDEEEARAVDQAFNLYTSADRIWVGASNLHDDDGKFKLIDGRLVDEVYSNWEEDEPNSFGDYHCVALKSSYELWVGNCKQFKYDFVCKLPINVLFGALSTTEPVETIQANHQQTNSGDVDAAPPAPLATSTDSAELSSHTQFGKLVGEELGQFPRKQRLQAMVSILQLLHQHWSANQHSCDVGQHHHASTPAH